MAQVAVVGDDQQAGRSVRTIDQSDVVDQGQDHRVGRARPAVSDGVPAAIRSPRRPRSAGPSKTSSMATCAGTTARNRPTNAAGGAAPGPRVKP